MSEPLQFFATAPRGVPSLLIEELHLLGAEGLKEQPAGVAFSGPLELAYRACLWSRTASRILLKLEEFPAASPEALYDGIQTIDWQRHLAADGSLAVDLTTTGSAIHHSHYGALKVKDAIVDQLRSATGVRPSVDTEQPDLRVNVHIKRDVATVSLDLAGESLHRRGYRKDGGKAPLKENLAAALLLRAGWPQLAAEGGRFVDPMCGSGTLLIEAALMAADIAPGLMRGYFGFLGWQQHDAGLWAELVAGAEQRRRQGLESLALIYGYDRDKRTVALARDNVVAAGLTDHVRIECRDVALLSPPEEGSTGLVMVNPPYGERLGEQEQLGGLYATLGERLKGQFGGWQAAVFTGNPELAKQMGIRAKKQHGFYNGALECRLLRFDINSEWFMQPRRAPQPARPEELTPAAEMLANRLRKNMKQLKRWLQKEEVACYRLYDADMPEYALAVDLYHDIDGCRWVHVQEYEAPKSVDASKAKARLREALAVLLMVLEIPAEQLYFKVRKRQKGSAQYEKVATEAQFHQVRENGCRFWVNFGDYLDTGLFLDHRITRGLVAELAGGEHFLNLFAYTGTASVYAAHGGAVSTTTVDMSRTYLDWGRRNMSLNGFEGEQHRFIQADCLRWLADEVREARHRYGLIFLDPPTFSTSKRMEESFDVQRDHVQLIRSALKLLKPGGVLIFSNNYRKFRLDQDGLQGVEVEDITKSTIPPDFGRNTKIHHCWKITTPANVWQHARPGVKP